MSDCCNMQRQIEDMKVQNSVGFIGSNYLGDNTVSMQRTSVQIYRLLINKKPVSILSIAEKVGMEEGEVKALISALPPSAIEYDENGYITAFIGLSIMPTKHKLFIDGKSLYTWCVFDGVFLPEILGKSANIITHCAVTGRMISVHLKPDALVSSEPKAVVMSIITPNKKAYNDSIRSIFCKHVNFFDSVDSYTAWKENNKNTEMLSLKQAHALAVQLNGARYKDINLGEKYV